MGGLAPALRALWQALGLFLLWRGFLHCTDGGYAIGVWQGHGALVCTLFAVRHMCAALRPRRVALAQRVWSALASLLCLLRCLGDVMVSALCTEVARPMVPACVLAARRAHSCALGKVVQACFGEGGSGVLEGGAVWRRSVCWGWAEVENVRPSIFIVACPAC